MSDVLQEVFDIFEDQCSRKGVRLTMEIDPRLIVNQLTSDRNRIKQILLNLLSNAFKFTFHGSISLKAAVIVDQMSEVVRFEVTDTGIGIKDEQQNKLFQLFSTISENNKINPHG